MRVAEGEHPHSIDEEDDGVGAGALVHNGSHRAEDVMKRGKLTRVDTLLQLAREDVEEEFRVRVGVDVAVLGDEGRGECVRVGEVAIVSQGNAVRRVRVQGLGLGGAGAASSPGSRVADMSNAHIASQRRHVRLGEDFTHWTDVLAEIETTLFGAGNNARGVLSAVLENHETIDESLEEQEEEEVQGKNKRRKKKKKKG